MKEMNTEDNNQPDMIPGHRERTKLTRTWSEHTIF